MSQYIGHAVCYQVLEQMLIAFEASGYTRLVQYKPGESVLLDSNPTPGYVPGVLGKKETGVEYVPKVDGTRVHVYYVAEHKASPLQRLEAARANKSGFDSHEIMGTLVSIRRMGDGIQLLFVAGNRDKIEGGVITDKVALRSVSITREPATKGGVIVALALDQMLGIPYHQLRALLGTEDGKDINVISAGLRVRRAAILSEGSEGIPEPGTGATGPSVGEEVK
jgi:hypothetical protein